MSGPLSLVVALACTALLAVVATPIAAARPVEPAWSFGDCTGPPGTPSSFTASHAASSGAAFRLRDGTATFVALIFVDVTAGKEFHPPGHDSTGAVTATCTVVNPFSGHTLRLSGFFTPVG